VAHWTSLTPLKDEIGPGVFPGSEKTQKPQPLRPTVTLPLPSKHLNWNKGNAL